MNIQSIDKQQVIKDLKLCPDSVKDYIINLEYILDLNRMMLKKTIEKLENR